MQKSQYILGKSYDFILIKSVIENHSLYSNEIETMMSSHLYSHTNERIVRNKYQYSRIRIDGFFNEKAKKKTTNNRCKSMFRIETSNQAI